ncbi:MAG: DPP IV N-terminal domain-containing protein, partial [Pseudomonadota bacterium]
MRTRILKILAICVVGLAASAAFVFAGYKLGSSTLETGVSAVDMAKLGLRRELGQAYSGPRVSPIWAPDGDSFVYNAAEDDGVDFKLVNPADGSTRDFIDENALQTALTNLFGQSAARDAIPFKTFDFIDRKTIEFVHADRRVIFDLDANRARFAAASTPENADPLLLKTVVESFPQVWPNQEEQFAPDHRSVLSLNDQALVIRDASGAEAVIAEKGPKFSDWIINESLWSADGRFLFVPKVDSTDVDKVPVVDWMNIAAPAEYIPYPTIFSEIMTFEGLIYDVEQGASVTIPFEQEHYVKPLKWLPDGSAVLCAVLSRDAREIEIVSIAPETGEIRTILSEKSESYFIYPPNFLFRGGPDFLLHPDGQSFLWISERTGFRQIYLYSINGELIRQLTDHPFEVATIDGVDPESGTILYTARSDPDRPYDIHVHSVNAETGQTTRLSDEEGQHEISVSPSGRFYIDKHSTTARPPIVELRASDGELIEVLSVGERPIGAEYVAPAPEHFSALAADGKTVIHGVIFKPSGFDAGKKYPVINGIYAGGFVNNVPYKFDARHPYFGRNMTELGFVTVVVDARGTPGRGREFKDVARQQFGQFEIADHVAAIKAAAQERPWMDTERVGIIGHSYGGYFALRGLLQAPDFFKVGVASGVPEKDKETSSVASEAFTGLFSDGADFSKISNAAIADRLEGQLLLVIQTSDVNTPPHGAIKIIDALTQARKPYDLILLPGANHTFRGS